MNSYLFMWVFVLFIKQHACQIEKASLVFVIDDTGSMGDDIDQVIYGANLVFDTVLNSNSSQIENFILVTFNDPDVKLRCRTTDRDEYKYHLRSIKVDGGGDCEEMSMAGIELALQESLSGSYLYVFTDASAKDFGLMNKIQNLAIKKNSQVVFLLTGRCNSDDNDPGYQAYYQLASATSGQVFHMGKRNVAEILKYVAETVSSRKTVVTSKQFPPGYGYNMTIPIDAGMHSGVISVSGVNPKINVTDPDGTILETNTIVDLPAVIAVKIPKTKPGNYTTKVGSESNTSVIVTAETSIHFKHGFSSVEPSSIKDTATRPIKGQQSHLLIQLITTDKGITLNSIHIMNMDEDVLADIPLKLIDRKQKIYVTKPNTFPDYLFKLAVNGYDRKSKTPFKRISATAIEPQNPDFEIPEGRKPLVTIENGIRLNAEYNNSLKLSCRVSGYPQPDIIWSDHKGYLLTSTVSAVELPYDHISILLLDQVVNNNTYTCRAVNEHGEDTKAIEVLTIQRKESPFINKSIEVIYKKLDDQVELTCKILRGFPKPMLAWYFLPANAQSFVQLNETQENLSLEHIGKDEAGAYRCVAANEVGYDRHMIHLIVEYPPTIDSVKFHAKSIEGRYTTLHCPVQGVPTPHVDWYINSNKIVNDRKHHIYRDHSLRFIGSFQNSGEFTCVATNSLGSVNKTTKVQYIAPVNIDPPLQSSFEIQAGEALVLPCQADGYPQPRIKWIFYGLNNVTKQYSPSDRSGLLNLNRVQLSQAGTYTCVASNVETSSNMTYEVKVLAPPHIIRTSSSKTQSAVLGDLVVRIPCKATGNPKPDITWSRNKLNIAAGTDWYDIEEDGTLVIKNIDKSSGGFYVCHANNKVGSDKESHNIVVTPIPVVLPDRTIKIEEGSSKKIDCGIPHSVVDIIRWYKDRRLISNAELTLDNVKISDSGTYTCRVSTFLNSRSNSVQVVVGSKPYFISDPVTDIDFEEDFTLYLDCEAFGYPKPTVTWSHGNYRIDTNEMVYETEMTFKKRGNYTCVVSNEFGSINRTFAVFPNECLINLKEDFSLNQPLMLETPFRLPLFENDDLYMRIPANKDLLLYCPKGFKNLPYTEITATCETERSFAIDGRSYNFSELICQEEIKPTIMRTGKHCINRNTEEIKVGYQHGDIFIEVYRICLDKVRNSPVYAQHRIHRSLAGVESSNVPKWSDTETLPLNYDDVYQCDRQIQNISALLGRWFHADDKCCFQKRQLVSPLDLIGGLAQKSTYTYLNVVPQWSSCNSKNWDELERRIRVLAKLSFDDLTVWTGISSDLTILNVLSEKENIALIDRNGFKQSVPQYIWKIVQNPETKSSIVIIQLNIPDISLHDASYHIACRDICRDISWLRGYDWRNPNNGFIFCCNLKDFEKSFGYKSLFGSENTNVLNSTSLLPIHSLL